MTELIPLRTSRLEREKKTIRKMIGLYCRKKHMRKVMLCEECSDMIAYTAERLDHCPFGENKPACSKCKVHCYQLSYRKHINSIMHFSGPRMLLYHPGFLISHYLDLLRYPPNPIKK